MSKNIWLRNRNLFVIGTTLLLVDISIILIWFFTKYFCGVVKVSQTFSFNILTIDAVFAGFAYNTLGTMTSFSANKSVAQFDSDGYLDKYYNGVYITLFLFIISMIVGSVTAFSKFGDMHHLLYLIQLIANMNAIVYFIVSIFGFRRLINFIREKLIK